MGFIQYSIVLIVLFDELNFSKIYYILIVILVYLPAQIIFKNISEKFFTKIINIAALLYGVAILSYDLVI